jgi:hypothetical protein
MASPLPTSSGSRRRRMARPSDIGPPVGRQNWIRHSIEVPAASPHLVALAYLLLVRPIALLGRGRTVRQLELENTVFATSCRSSVAPCVGRSYEVAIGPSLPRRAGRSPRTGGPRP